MIGFKSLIVGLFLAHAVVGDLDLSDNIFIKHMISSRAAPFQAPTYLPPVENLVCHGQDVCVRASECVNGYFSADIGVAKRTCDINSEVCCTYKPKPTPLPAIPCESSAFDCVSPNQCVNGEISIKGYKQKVADQCFAPEVCCRIPVESTVLEKDGYHVRVPDTPFIIEKTTPRPFVPQPSPSVHVPATQPPVYIPPVTPAPVRPVPVRTPAPTVFVPQTQAPVYLPPATPAPVHPTPAVYVPPRTPAPTVYVPPRTPAPTVYVPQTQPPVYLPPATPKAPIRIPQPTAKPVIVVPTRPARPIVSTQAPIYLPPTPPRRGEDIKSEPIYKPKPTQVYLPPSRGENILSEPIYKKTIQACAAALKCTPIDYCTKEGVISKTPVSLSPNEELYRVPLTDCADESSGAEGKCCRDPDYVDPWPTNLLISGQYDPTLFQQN